MSQLVPLPSDKPLQDNKCKLVYNNTLDTNTIQNILLISSCVTESQLFYESANNNTFPIIYSPNSDKDELIELLRDKFKNGFKRITFAFHDPLNNTKTFVNNKPFFDESDLIENQKTFSETVTFLTNLITEFKVENCDFLACNTLQYANWKKYYELLNKVTNVICGASNDKTGNIQYGADWVMENTNENVRDIYFTSSISNYASSLAVFTVDYVIYSITGGSTVSITGYSGTLPNPWDLVIPATITDPSTLFVYNVTGIGDSAFQNCSDLRTVSISDSVTSISQYAFFNCTALTSISIPDSVTSIGDWAFYTCLALTTVIIGNSVTSIGTNVFYNCPDLTTVTIDASNANYSSDASGILFNKLKTILIFCPEGFNGLYIIPNSVITILDNAFQYCTALTSITIPDSVTSIGYGAFYSCSALTSITIPDSVTSIGDSEFEECSALGTVTIGNSVTSIGNSAFYNCTALTSVTFLGSTIPSIGTDNFTIDGDTAYYNSGTTNTSALTMFTYTSVNSLPISNICFPAKTPVRTCQGLIHIDKINPDLHTIRNKKIVAITKTITQDKYLVCLEKDSLGPNVPSEKTIITKNHLIFNNGEMTKAKEFIGKYENVYKVKYNGEILYNVLLEEPNKMMVNNLICETLHPKNAIAKLYKIISNFNLKQQSEIIKRVNENTIKNNILTSSKK